MTTGERTTDHAALSETETQLRVFTSRLPGFFWTTDTEMRLTLRLGRDMEPIDAQNEEVLGRHIGDFIGTRDESAPCLAAHRRALGGEMATYEQEWEGRCYSAHVEPLRSEDGSITGVIGVAFDITERKQAEQALQAARAELETHVAHALRVSTLGEMAAGLAHEINQPLSAIVNYARGCVTRLRSGMAEREDLLFAIEQIAAQALRGGEIVRRYRRFLRAGTAHREPVNVNTVVENVVRFMQTEAQADGAVIRLALAEQLPAVPGDGVQLEQVVLNLTRNGLEAMRDGSPAELWIRTSVDASEIAVAVEDRGRGVPQDLQERIFDAFFTTKPDGLGMGLSICRTIVEAHGGRLSATANPEGGTTFRFTLPLPRNGDAGGTRGVAEDGAASAPTG